MRRYNLAAAQITDGNSGKGIVKVYADCVCNVGIDAVESGSSAHIRIVKTNLDNQVLILQFTDQTRDRRTTQIGDFH